MVVNKLFAVCQINCNNMFYNLPQFWSGVGVEAKKDKLLTGDPRSRVS